MTIEKVAAWMSSELESEGTLYQDVAVDYIARTFGETFIETNANGNQAIKRQVLEAFNQLTPHAIWSRSGRYWRPRESFDLPGRQQP